MAIVAFDRGRTLAQFDLGDGGQGHHGTGLGLNFQRRNPGDILAAEVVQTHQHRDQTAVERHFGQRAVKITDGGDAHSGGDGLSGDAQTGGLLWLGRDLNLGAGQGAVGHDILERCHAAQPVQHHFGGGGQVGLIIGQNGIGKLVTAAIIQFLHPHIGHVGQTFEHFGGDFGLRGRAARIGDLRQVGADQRDAGGHLAEFQRQALILGFKDQGDGGVAHVKVTGGRGAAHGEDAFNIGDIDQFLIDHARRLARVIQRRAGGQLHKDGDAA